MSHINLEGSRTKSLRQQSSRYGAARQVLSGTYVIPEDGPQYYFLDPGLANRTVRLPALENVGGFQFWIFNISSTFTLFITDADGIALDTVGINSSKVFFASQREWGSLGGASVPAGSTVPTGGLTGWWHRKVSATDYDDEWAIPGSLTKVDDTNVTLTLGGFPTTALLRDVSLTLGWTGTLATARIGDDQVTYAKMQNVSAASKLLGRGDSGSGDPQEITIGAGLTMTGTTLSSTGGGGTGDVVGPAAATDNAIARFDATTGKLIQNSVVLIDDTTGTLHLGTNDLGSLGTGLLAWSDLFLASGAVINFNNGNYTITHSAGLLTTNGNLSLTTAGVLTTGTIELGAASDTTLSRASAGVLAVEGVNVLTTATGQPLDATLTALAGLTITQGSLIYGTGADAFAVLAKDVNATRYLSNTGATNNPAWAQIDLTNGVTGDLPFANLAQGLARSVLGVTGNAGADVASIQGTADQVLVVNGAGTALAFGTVATAGITADAVTYAKMQNVSAISKLLGRGSAAGAGDPEEITLGTGLTMTGTTLSVSAAGTGDVVGPASATDNAIARFDTTTGKLIQNSVVLIDDTTGTLHLGTNDLGSLGTGLLSWSDLFLASGAVINFNNGNYTITHTAGVLTTNGALSIGTGNAFTCGTIELGAATDTTLARVSAGVISVEGVTILTTATGQPLDATLTALAGLTIAQGDLIYGTGADAFATLAKNVTATRYLSNTGATNNPAWAQIDLSNGVTGDLPFANLAQGLARSVLGVTGNVGADVASIQGTADQVLVVNGAGTALAFGTVATAGITASAVTYAKIQNVSATDRLLGRDTAAAGVVEELTVGGGIEFTGSLGIQRSALTGDATATAGSNATKVVSASEAFALTGDISPAAITANQNDYNPTGLSTASVLRLSSDASRTITGLQGGADGRILFIHNVGTQNIILADESASSLAANRFALTASMTLAGDQIAILMYDSTSSRWRALSSGGGGGSGDMLAANNLSDVASAATAFSNIKQAATTSATGVLEIATEAETKLKLSTTLAVVPDSLADFNRGYLHGLTLSNNATDAVNDIDIAIGACAAESDPYPIMVNATAGLTKRLDAAWAVGDGNGGLDTGAIANTTYHIWLIMRSDTGVVDALFSASATAPTMPASYDYKRRIGSVVRTAAAIKAFTQKGDRFMWLVGVNDVNITAPGTSAVLRTLTVPTGIKLEAIFSAFTENATTNHYCLITDPDQTDSAAAFTLAQLGAVSANAYSINGALRVFTNTSAQIRTRFSASGASDTFWLNTFGWTDTRGRDE